MEEFEILWRGSYTYDEVIENKGYNEKDCLYAISHEPLVRKSKTLYLGRAIDQYIGDRLKSHNTDNEIFDDYGERSINYYIGRIKLKSEQRWSTKRIKDVETAIIFHHGEYLECNIMSTQSYSGRSIKIKHLGNVPPGLEDFAIK